MFNVILDVSSIDSPDLRKLLSKSSLLDLFDVVKVTVREHGESVLITWFTCTGNPGAAMQTLREQGLHVLGWYWDPNSDLAGYYSNGVGEEYEHFSRLVDRVGISGLNYDQRGIANRFGIGVEEEECHG